MCGWLPPKKGSVNRVDPPIKGWCQTVPSEGNSRLILRLDLLIRSGLQARAMWRGFPSPSWLVLRLDLLAGQSESYSEANQA
jgi:hypothetical protein